MPAPPRATAASSAATAHAASNVHAKSTDDVFYPSSDGKPMAENTWQSEVILHAAGEIGVMHPAALVAVDVLVYPERGNRYNSIAPDVLVALDLGMGRRSSYKVWEEGKPPDWVLEVASPSTEENDRCSKRDDYAAMGVQEYWLFDPKGDVFPAGTPRLRGLTLDDGEYQPLESRIENGVRMIHSKVLGLGVRAEGDLLRFWDPATRRDVRRHPEEAAGRVTAEARADREAAARTVAESRIAGAEARAVEAEARVAGVEARAVEAEARVAELEAALQRAQLGRTTD